MSGGHGRVLAVQSLLTHVSMSLGNTRNPNIGLVAVTMGGLDKGADGIGLVQY